VGRIKQALEPYGSPLHLVFKFSKPSATAVSNCHGWRFYGTKMSDTLIRAIVVVVMAIRYV
jgi:hypothetical protein